MKVIRYPKRTEWADILRRPSVDAFEVEPVVRQIIARVKTEGDRALRSLTREFDGVELDSLAVTDKEFAAAASRVPEELKRAIRTAYCNIHNFHVAQIEDVNVVETTPGVMCWRRSVAIERVGLYVPAGTAPLFSTVLMLAIPARIAGCSEITLCSPVNKDGAIHDSILFTAELCGVTNVFKIGGAQAIAAMAYGSESVPRVDKIFGPGNRFVTLAKQIVSRDVAIDMPAGPSELAILADSSADPRFVAADLLSQAEHGADSHVLLVTNDEELYAEVLDQIKRQLTDLPRREIAAASLAKSSAVIIADLAEGLDLLNSYAPEHLIIAVADADRFAEMVVNAGSVFIGNYASESAGDYATGTNHTLPTAGFARSSGGLSVDTFVKKITFQKLTADGLRKLGPTVAVLAAAEGLTAHERAITIRLEVINE